MITLNMNSWHYRMAGRVSNGDHNGLCEYGRRVLSGTALFSVITFVVGWFVIWNIMGVVLAVQGMYTTTGAYHLANMLLMVSVSATVFVFGIAMSNDFFMERQRLKYIKQRREPENNPSGFLSSWFTAWKNKVCPQIKFIHK